MKLPELGWRDVHRENQLHGGKWGFIWKVEHLDFAGGDHLGSDIF